MGLRANCIHGDGENIGAKHKTKWDGVIAAIRLHSRALEVQEAVDRRKGAVVFAFLILILLLLKGAFLVR
jgi:hypothetical protein